MSAEQIDAFCKTQIFHNLVIQNFSTHDSKNTWWETLEAMQGRAAEAAIWQSTYAIEFLRQTYPGIAVIEPRWKPGDEGIEFDVLIQLDDGLKAFYSDYDTAPDQIPQWALDVDEGKVFSWAVVIMEEAITNNTYNTFEMATVALSGNPDAIGLAQIRMRDGGRFELAWQAHLLECATPKARGKRPSRRV